MRLCRIGSRLDRGPGDHDREVRHPVDPAERTLWIRLVATGHPRQTGPETTHNRLEHLISQSGGDGQIIMAGHHKKLGVGRNIQMDVSHDDMALCLHKAEGTE